MRDYLVKNILDEHIELSKKIPHYRQINFITPEKSFLVDIVDILDVGNDYVSFKSIDGEKVYFDYKFIQMILLK